MGPGESHYFSDMGPVVWLEIVEVGLSPDTTLLAENNVVLHSVEIMNSHIANISMRSRILAWHGWAVHPLAGLQEGKFSAHGLFAGVRIWILHGGLYK